MATEILFSACSCRNTFNQPALLIHIIGENFYIESPKSRKSIRPVVVVVGATKFNLLFPFLPSIASYGGRVVAVQLVQRTERLPIVCSFAHIPLVLLASGTVSFSLTFSWREVCLDCPLAF